MSSGCKNCPNCGSNQVVKIGFQTGRRRYKCKGCEKKFQSKSQNTRKHNSLMDQLTFKKTLVM